METFDFNKEIQEVRDHESLEFLCVKWNLTEEETSFAQEIMDTHPDLLTKCLEAFMSSRKNQVTKYPDDRILSVNMNYAIQQIFNNETFRRGIQAFGKAFQAALEEGLDDTALVQRASELRVRYLQDLPITFVAGDASNLKVVNDSLGHDMGNETLRTCVKTIDEHTPGTTYHQGGDEFGVLVPATIKDVGTIESALEEVNNSFRRVDEGEYSHIKRQLQEQLDVVLRVDFGVVHMSEAIQAFAELCRFSVNTSSRYCNFTEGMGVRGFHQLAKSITDLMKHIGDRRALMQKHFTKFKQLYEQRGSAEYEKLFTLYTQRGLSVEATTKALQEAFELDARDQALTLLKQRAFELAQTEQKRVADVQENERNYLDQVAFRGV